MPRLVVRWTFCLALLAAIAPAWAQPAYTPPAASAEAVKDVPFAAAAQLDAGYAEQFSRCDAANRFRGFAMTGWRKCSGDPNRLKALLRFPDGTVFFDSKMGLDIDGSWKACEAAGPTDLCPTWYTWPGLSGRQSFLDSDQVPYIVIPIAVWGTIPRTHAKEFRERTGIGRGDFAVVIYDGKVVPAIVGDGGPFNKIGEASNAVFVAVGKDRCRDWRPDQHCRRYRNASLEGDVLTFVFPGSARPDIKKVTALETIREEALKRFKTLKAD